MLNVIGIIAFIVLPFFLAALTSADEFHSVTKTRCPSANSHFARRPSCVVFPDPSIPSTTNSLPGYSWGLLRLLSISVPTDLDAERLADQLLEGSQLPSRCPDFELGIALRSHAEQSVLTKIVELDARHNLRMTAIEVRCKSQIGGKRLNRSLPAVSQRAVAIVAATGLGTAMIARNESDCLDFVGLESSQIAVLYQVIRMFVMA